MIKYIYSIFIFIFLFSSFSFSQEDTIFIQAHDYIDLDWYGDYDALAEFPDNNTTYRKILMHYDMRCSSSGCSGWDYTTKISLLQPSEDLDENDNMIYIHDQTIANVITPYGTYMQGGGSEGFSPNWVQRYTYDVTDFAPLLKGPVMMRAFYGGWSTGFNVTISFEFIEGTPPRNVIDIQNLWSGSNSYADLQSILSETSVNIPSEVKNSMLRVTISGHGQDGEFTPGVNYFVDVNGSNVYTQEIWRDDCGEVALYPQGGTWVYDRANWCPGDKATTRNHELTPFINNGEDNSIDFDIYRANWNPSEASYIYDAQLFTYGEPNFTLDAALEDIISPSLKHEHFRLNPSCSSPIIKIKNNGSENLTSVHVTYGFNESSNNTIIVDLFEPLEFGESKAVELPPINWESWDSNSSFFAHVHNPNEAIDEYDVNNILHSDYEYVDEYPSKFAMWFRTNSFPNESSYELRDNFGTLIFAKNGMSANTLYKDTFDLDPGCYKLQILDTGGSPFSNEDGLSWWANNDGSGYARLRAVPGGFFKYYESDFGTELTDYFRVGEYTVNLNEKLLDPIFEIYPNPANNKLNFDLELFNQSDVKILIYNLNGKIVYEHYLSNFLSGLIEVDISQLINGVYSCFVESNAKVYQKKIVIVK